MSIRLKTLSFNILKTAITALLLLMGMVGRAQKGSDLDNLLKLEKQVKEYSENGEPIKLAQTLSKMGLIYTQIKDYENAISSYKQSSSLYLQNKKLSNVRKIYSNIGFIYSDQDDYENALSYMKMALKTAVLQNNDTAISGCLTDVAYILIIEREYHVAIDQLLEALAIAQTLNHKQLIIKCYSMLMECYRALGMNAKFIEYQNKLNNFTNHINQETAKQEITDLQIQNKASEEIMMMQLRLDSMERRNAALEYEKKQKAFDEIREQQIAEHNQKEQEQQKQFNQLQKQAQQAAEKAREESDKQKAARRQLISYLTAGGIFLLLLILVAILIWRNAKKTRQLNSLLKENNMILEKQSKQIEQWAMELSETNAKISIQQQAISDSIAYAKHIQMSMLIRKDLLKKEIPQLAIFFRPRDVVSGDFYWFHKKNQKLYLAAIDCTGHGVPGAMISMIGYNILENIMANTLLEHPNEIMDKMHMDIRQTLRQDTTENHDGMDMSLCMIDKRNNILEYCGAKNAMVIARPGQEAEKIKPDSFGIGGLVNEDPENPNPTGVRRFTNVDIPVYNDATYYIFSDGFSDQFGGENSKKYMLGKFRKFLGSICHLPIDQQEQCMKQEFMDWRGDLEQTDDILLIGFKI